MKIEQLPNCVVHSKITQEQDEKAWLNARKSGIGGSDIGPICGVSPYSCARKIYNDKVTDETEEHSDATLELFYWGHVLESVVADEFSKRTELKTAISPWILAHKLFPWALANVDRFIVDEEGNPIGVLECKTTSESQKGHWFAGEIPVTYLYQLQWYLWITNLSVGYIACLIGGNKFIYYRVDRNENFISTMAEKASYFWNYHVLNKIPSDLDGSESASNIVDKQYSKAIEKSKIDLSNYNDLIEKCVVAGTELKSKKEEFEKYSNQIKELMQDNEVGLSADYTVKWSNSKRETLDTKKLKADLPDIYNQYKKVSESRRFTIKEE